MSKTRALRKDADESLVPLNEPGTGAVRDTVTKDTVTKDAPRKDVVVKKFEVVLDRNKPEPLGSVIQRYIETMLDEFDGNKARTAEALGIGRTTVYRKMGLRKD